MLFVQFHAGFLYSIYKRLELLCLRVKKLSVDFVCVTVIFVIQIVKKLAQLRYEIGTFAFRQMFGN